MPTKLLSVLLLASLLTACKGAPQDAPKADAPASDAPTAQAPSPDAAKAPDAPATDKLPADKGVALDAYTPANDGFKGAWEAAVKGGSIKALCDVWLGGADKGTCFEDSTAKRASFGPAHALVFIAERFYTEEEGGMGGHMDAILLVEHAGRFYQEVLASAHNGGVGYAGGDVEIKLLEAKEVADGGSPELILEVELSTWDGDTSTNTREVDDLTETGVLQLQQGGPRWRMFAKTATLDGEEIMIEGEQPTPTLDAPKKATAKLIWHPATAEVEAQGVEGEEPLYPPGKVSIDKMPQRESD